jgi:hypothetical protein
MKEEFEKFITKDPWGYDIMEMDADVLWAWIEKELKKEYQRGFDNGLKWSELEHVDEDITDVCDEYCDKL